MTIGHPQWKIELLVTRTPTEDWVELRHENGKRYRFVDRYQADEALAKLRKVQPHVTYRIVRI